MSKSISHNFLFGIFAAAALCNASSLTSQSVPVDSGAHPSLASIFDGGPTADSNFGVLSVVSVRDLPGYGLGSFDVPCISGRFTFCNPAGLDTPVLIADQSNLASIDSLFAQGDTPASFDALAGASPEGGANFPRLPPLTFPGSPTGAADGR